MLIISTSAPVKTILLYLRPQFVKPFLHRAAAWHTEKQIDSTDDTVISDTLRHVTSGQWTNI